MKNSTYLILKFFKETCLNDSRVYFAVSRLTGSSLNEVFLGEGEKGERGPSQYCCLSQYHINCFHVSTLESVEKKTLGFTATGSFYS